MHADCLGVGEQLVKGLAAARIAQRQLVGDVVEDDPHAQRLGHHRELAADVAVPHDAQGASTDLMGAGR